MQELLKTQVSHTLKNSKLSLKIKQNIQNTLDRLLKIKKKKKKACKNEHMLHWHIDAYTQIWCKKYKIAHPQEFSTVACLRFGGYEK